MAMKASGMELCSRLMQEGSDRCTTQAVRVSVWPRHRL